MTRILVVQNDPANPPENLGRWLESAGADLDLRCPYRGDEVPARLDEHDALVVLGGEMGCTDDDVAPWLPGLRALLVACVAARRPTLGICLGAQLLAVATGGTVERGELGPEIGAHLAGKRDAAQDDPLFELIPMMPDVMQYHYDAVTELPPGARLLLNGTGYPNQAWRIGPAAWGLQFHIECTAERLRGWATAEGLPPSARLATMLDDAEAAMEEVWGGFAHRFVAFAEHRDTAGPIVLPLVDR